MTSYKPMVYTWLVVLLAVGACGQTASQEQPPEPEKVDFIDKREWGTWERVDEDTRIPSGLHPADSFDWAPDDLPIFFHTEQESERTNSEWAPFFKGSYLNYPNEKIAFKMKVQGQSRYDKNFDHMPHRWFLRRGAFIGVGYPVAGDYLHMFECGGVELPRYRVGDFIFRCNNTASIDVFVIADPDAPPPPRFSPNDPGRGAPERLPGRWLAWFLEARRAQSAAQEAHPFDFSKLKRLDIYAYAAPEQRGIVTQRYIEPGALRSPGSGDYSWSLWPHRIPAEYCTDDGLELSTCKP
jgi:hypothetical protein